MPGISPYTWKYDNLKLQGGQALTINLSVDKQGVSLGGDVTVGEWEVIVSLVCIGAYFMHGPAGCTITCGLISRMRNIPNGSDI